VKLTPIPNPNGLSSTKNLPPDFIEDWQAEPIFGKSNLIFTLINADGLIRISPEMTGLSVGERVEVVLL
jgi:molybdopterin biosynthesis enzyme